MVAIRALSSCTAWGLANGNPGSSRSAIFNSVSAFPKFPYFASISASLYTHVLEVTKSVTVRIFIILLTARRYLHADPRPNKSCRSQKRVLCRKEPAWRGHRLLRCRCRWAPALYQMTPHWPNWLPTLSTWSMTVCFSMMSKLSTL